MNSLGLILFVLSGVTCKSHIVSLWWACDFQDGDSSFTDSYVCRMNDDFISRLDVAPSFSACSNQVPNQPHVVVKGWKWGYSLITNCLPELHHSVLLLPKDMADCRKIDPTQLRTNVVNCQKQTMVSMQQTTPQQTTAQQTMAQQATVQQTTAQQATVQQTTAQQATVQQTTAQQTKVQQTTAQQTKVQQTTAQQTKVQQTTAQQTKVQQTKAQQTKVQARQIMIQPTATTLAVSISGTACFLFLCVGWLC